MPGPIDLLRLVALAVFLALVAVGLWLLDVAWYVVIPVMAAALVVAWMIEWLAWRQRPAPVVAMPGEPPRPAGPPEPIREPEAVPAEAILPPAPGAEPAAEPVGAGQAPPAKPAEPEPAAEPKPPPPAGPPPPPQAAPPRPPAPPREEPPREPRRPRRVRLRPVPAPRPEPQPEPEPEPSPPPAAATPVAAFRPRTVEPRQWNLWDLERIARDELRQHPERRDEWAFLFLHLRQFADADGSLPAEFDGLVRESFAGLLERAPGA